MTRMGLLLAVLLNGATILNAQPRPVPQTARQALLEMFFSKDQAAFQKHLPEATLAALRKADSDSAVSMLQQFSSLGSQFTMNGQQLQTFDTGSTLVVVEDARTRSKFEITVEGDDLRSDEDQIDLSFHVYKDGQPDNLPVLPRFTFLMKSEGGVWRLNEIMVALRVPLADPDFLKTMMTDMQRSQRPANEAAAVSTMRTIMVAEGTYASTYPAHGYTCSLSDLDGFGGGEPNEHQAMLIDSDLVSGKKNGYVFTLSGCGTNPASNYRLTAVPAAPESGSRAFCADESGIIRYSSDGKGATCLSAGKPLQ
jgi:type IV pilus assembly protein PilA